MDDVDLKNFTVVKNDGKVVFVNKTNVMLQNTKTGEVFTTAYDNVASFYGLDNLSSNSPEIQIDDNFVDYFQETICKTAPSESSEEDAPVEDENSQYRSIIKWEPEESKYLLALHSKYAKLLGPRKRFRTKKVMWTYIAKKLAEKFKISPTATQVESRFKCIARRIKSDASRIQSKRPMHMFQTDIFSQSQKEDPIGFEAATAPTQILMIKPSKQIPAPLPKPTIQPPGPSELLKLIPPSDYEDENTQCEATTASGRKLKKPLQIVMFEKYLQQKAKFYEKREVRSDERVRHKAEREKEKDLLKQQRNNERIEREKEREDMRQRRHLEKMQLLKQILNKQCKN